MDVKRTINSPHIFLWSLAVMLMTTLLATDLALGAAAQITTYPPGDVCDEALPVEDVTNLPFDTTGARFGGRGLCMRSPNIWYCYTAPCTGDVTVSLAGSSYDTMLAVYEGCQCFPTASDLIACNDDFGGTYQSQVSFPALAGNQYLIEVGGYGSLSGKGLITIQCEGALGAEKPDLGDAPDSRNHFGTVMHAYPSQGFLQYLVPAHYPSVYDDGSGSGPFGPVHLNVEPAAYLGKKISGETEADTGFDEDGENNIIPTLDKANRDNGDDGLLLPLILPHCGWATIDYEVTVLDPNVALWVNAWFDWNRDGDWDDSVECPAGAVSEWGVKNQYLFGLSAGRHQITTPGFLAWHPLEEPQQIWLRITLSEQPWTGGSRPGEQGNAGSGPLTKYEIGETEDYLILPDPADDEQCPLCQDVNNDGSADMEDLILLVGKWLENCL